MSEELGFVITGAASYLGRALAQLLIEEPNVSLVLTSHRETDFTELQATGRVLYCPNIDLTDEFAVSSFANQVGNFFKGRFHVLNCVGYFPGYRSLESISVTDAQRVYASNVLCVYSAAYSLLPLMQARGGGSFVAFSSHTVYQAYPLMAAFTSAKAAVESLVRSIAYEFSKDKITANTIALATLATDEEIRLKPHGDHANWLQPIQVCQLVRQLVESPFSILNGNTLHVYNHSETYFHQSYFERIS